LKEAEVTEIVCNWLKLQYPEETIQKQSWGADLAIFKITTPSNQWQRHNTIYVECKKTEASDGKLDRAVGQVLRYYMRENKPPTFLAVPHDYEKMDELRKIL